MVLYFFIVLGFNIWMLIDALRRHAELHWLLILIFFAPVGSVLYFGLVKIHDYDLQRFVGRRVPSAASLNRLMERAQETPSLENQLEYADALQEGERYADAHRVYSSALIRDPEDKRALYGQACCQLSLGKPAESLAPFARLMELDKQYRDFGAALDYAEALWQAKESAEAIGLLEGLAAYTGRLNHRLALAYYLMQDGQKTRAREELARALEQYAAFSPSQRQRNQKWAKRAQHMLAELGSAQDERLETHGHEESQ